MNLYAEHEKKIISKAHWYPVQRVELWGVLHTPIAYARSFCRDARPCVSTGGDPIIGGNTAARVATPHVGADSVVRVVTPHVGGNPAARVVILHIGGISNAPKNIIMGDLNRNSIY